MELEAEISLQATSLTLTLQQSQLTESQGQAVPKQVSRFNPTKIGQNTIIHCLLANHIYDIYKLALTGEKLQLKA